ncbi:rna-directed dna polymerase from mobile element jockey-like [Willisornis vidua]|uniref:Rna-directed dna polymerase from mobile element jockey-like n=1 Tax=Willisornis vidua TaxID=1566151 RepID=A0ABQ9CR26_9PASS|nr:rna-directed dna polymerase from mobile element jockey-like [Willisornis vidua]
MDEHGASGKIQKERRNIWDVKKVAGHMGGLWHIFMECKDAMKKTKAHLELSLAWGIKDNKKGFYKYISSKRKTRENVGLLLNQMGVLLIEDTKAAELLNTFFASVSTAKAGRSSEIPDLDAKRGRLEKGRISRGCRGFSESSARQT